MPGGRIPPDGRPKQAPGVGSNSKRHDLERPKTPGLHDSDLQQGDVQALEEGQRIVGKTTQGAARPQPSSGGASSPGAGGMAVPDAGQFIRGRLRNTMQGSPGPAVEASGVDPTHWLPLMAKMATAPGAGGLLTAAYIEQLGAATQRHVGQVHTLDMNELDDRVREQFA